MNGEFVYLIDRFVPAAQAVIHYSDLALQRGYGVFDFFRVTRGKPAFFDDHLDRFFHSTSRMRLDVGKTRDQMKAILYELLRRNNLPESGVRINVTGGYSEDAYSIGTPNLVITQRSLPPAADVLARGIKLVTHEHRRQFDDVKSLDYMMAIWLQPTLKERTADDLLYHWQGVVTECPRANFFIVADDGRVLTPRSNILRGVVRKHTLKLAAKRYKVEETDVRLEDVARAREAFITSTTKGPAPVVAIDGHPLSGGKPGEVTRGLMRDFEELLAASLG